MQTDPASLDPEERNNKFYALASAALGVLSLCGGFIVPAFGTILSILGILLGIQGRKSENRRSATVGIALSIVGLLTAIIYSLLLYFAKY
jgi:hypothetical protein